MISSIYCWEYFRKRKDNKLNRIISKNLSIGEVYNYIKNDWLQAELTIKDKTGMWRKIGHITISGDFMTYNSNLRQFERFEVNKLTEWLDLEETSIKNGVYR